MCAMDKVNVPHIEQQLRLNRSARVVSTDKSLFYLYLSMLEKDLSNLPRFADNASTDEIVYADIESHYYKHPSLQFSSPDYKIQPSFSRAVEQESNSTLQLLNAFFPQGLSEHNDHLRIDDEVIDGLDYFAKQRIQNAKSKNDSDCSDSNELATDETLLFDLIPKATEFLI